MTEPSPSPDETAAQPQSEKHVAGDSAKLVPVSESIKYRRRAQQAESELGALREELEQLQSELEGRADQLAEAEAQRDEAHHQLREAETRSLAERVLQQAGVVDLETASVLLDRRIDLSREDLDGDALETEVEHLLLDKPFLRPVSPSLPPATATQREESSSSAARLAEVARTAAQSGNRRDIAEYLRLKRAVGRG